MTEQSLLLTPGQRIRPCIDSDTAKTLAEDLYGFTIDSIDELNAYDDKNYHIICKKDCTNPHITEVDSCGYVLKIVNSLDSRKSDVTEAQTAMLNYLNDQGLVCPRPVKNLEGGYYSAVSLKGSTEMHVVRLLVYRPGELLHRVNITDNLMVDVGSFAATLDKMLRGFSHPAYDGHRSLWMLSQVPELRQFSFAVSDADKKHLVEEVIAKFESEVLASINELEVGVIHGDLNEQNIIVDEQRARVTAVIDFNDAQKSCLIFELAVALCYMMLQTQNVGTGAHVIRGYESVRRLTVSEKRVLRISVCARLCQSLVLGAYSHLNDPQNEYLLVTQKPGWTLLRKLWSMEHDAVLAIWGLVGS